MAANFFGNGLEGIFGCPSYHEQSPSLQETLKLFLPYFPLHIQKLIHMYLQLIDFMHTFEMVQNMMNHMDEYQALFQMFDGMDSNVTASAPIPPVQTPMGSAASFFGNGNFSMPDFGSMQKMMEGSDLVDEFTYMEEPPGTERDGS